MATIVTKYHDHENFRQILQLVSQEYKSQNLQYVELNWLQEWIGIDVVWDLKL